MNTKKYLIQKITQRIDSLLDKIDYLEDSKFMQNRYDVSEMQREYKRLQEERLNLKTQ
tara:strand:- start:7573 stop:7746 length:174 start_codon:yes stop_codon:yes gene_type:complete